VRTDCQRIRFFELKEFVGIRGRRDNPSHNVTEVFASDGTLLGRVGTSFVVCHRDLQNLLDKNAFGSIYRSDGEIMDKQLPSKK
jgi:hypothetical protein